MTTDDLQRLAALCIIVEHLEQRGKMETLKPFSDEKWRLIEKCKNPDPEPRKGKR